MKLEQADKAGRFLSAMVATAQRLAGHQSACGRWQVIVIASLVFSPFTY